MTNENRNRVQPGVPTGGQFAPEHHTESSVTLAPSPLDAAALTAAGDLARTRYSEELGRWQRRMDKGSRGGAPWPPLPEVLFDAGRQSENFETLPRDEQEALLEKLQIPGAGHLLEPGQRLGNDTVRVADGLDTTGGDIGLALTAQKLITDAGIPGDITLTDVGRNLAVFTVQDGTISHRVRIGARSLGFSANSGDGEDYDYDRDDWLCRADIMSAGGSVYEKDRTADLKGNYQSHREYAVMMDAVASSSFRGAEQLLGELGRHGRTAVIKADGTEHLLDVSGDVPVLKTEDGSQALHPSMVSGFLNHLATKTGHPDGDAFAADLREVFREMDRRLIP
jgi:hypothetical protein